MNSIWCTKNPFNSLIASFQYCALIEKTEMLLTIQQKSKRLLKCGMFGKYTYICLWLLLQKRNGSNFKNTLNEDNVQRKIGKNCSDGKEFQY